MAMKLSVETIGTGDPVVLLHGLLGDGGNLRALARRLAADHCAYLPDLRNHGRSPHGDAMDWHSLAADVAETLEACGVRSFHLLGHSLGGKVAMQLAAEFPACVQSLALLDIAPVEYPLRHLAIMDGLADLESRPPHSREEAMQRLAAWVPGEGERAFLLKNLLRGEDGAYRLRCNLRAIAGQYPMLAGVPLWPGDYRGPVLMLRGGLSDYVDARGVAAMQSSCPQVRLHTIEGTGHWLNTEKPDAVAAALQGFWSSLLRA